jgi:hypothetical protein
VRIHERTSGEPGKRSRQEGSATLGAEVRCVRLPEG